MSDHEKVLQLLNDYEVSALPWKVTTSDSKAISEKVVRCCSQLHDGSPLEEFFESGINASKDNDFCNAAHYFTLLLESCGKEATERVIKDSLFNMACLYHMSGFVVLALPMLEELLIHNGAQDMTTHSFLWSIAQGNIDTLSCSGVVNSFVQGQILGVYSRLAAQGDVMAKHKLQALTVKTQNNENCKQKGDPNYAAIIFNDMAPVFEKRLVDDLKYDCPWQMKRLLGVCEIFHVFFALNIVVCDNIDNILEKEDASSSPLLKAISDKVGTWRILDVGCGSGLIGRLFCSYTGQTCVCVDGPSTSNDMYVPRKSISECSKGPCILGVDISEKMCSLAFHNGGYTATICADLEYIVKEAVCASHDFAPFDMVVAADTFLYVGRLEEVEYCVKQTSMRQNMTYFSYQTFAAVVQSLNEGGIFMFSTEDLQRSPMRNTTDSSKDNGVELLSSARYAHSQSYIEHLSCEHGFCIVHIENMVIRKEATVSLPGQIFILQKIL